MADPRQTSPPADDAFVDRTLRFLDGLLVDDADVRQFNADLAASPDRRETFVRLCELRGLLLEHRLVAVAPDDEPADEAIVPPPWFERPVEVERPRRTWPSLALAAAVLLPLILTLALYVTLRPRTIENTTLARGGNGAARPTGAATLPDLTPRRDTTTTPRDTTPAATLVATAQARWSTGADLRPGQLLPPGPLELTAGFAELRLKSGVSLILQAPVRVDVRPDAMSADLARGKLTATVPPAARGFAVQTASATVVDFGTEFGVEADPDKSTRVEVFQGQVEAAPARAAETQSRQRLTKDQAAQVAPDAAAVRLVPPTPAADQGRAFVRDLAAARMPIPLHDTGAGLADGQADPYWQVVTDPEVAPDEYRPATVQPDCWISAGKAPTLFPADTYTFRTTVDLTGFHADTATIAARLSGADSVGEVRVNGKSVGVRVTPADPANPTAAQTIEIPTAAFTPGPNPVEFAIHHAVPPNRQRSPLLLQVQWTATAAPVVVR